MGEIFLKVKREKLSASHLVQAKKGNFFRDDNTLPLKEKKKKKGDMHSLNEEFGCQWMKRTLILCNQIYI